MHVYHHIAHTLSHSQFLVQSPVLVDGNDLGNNMLVSPHSEMERMNCPHEEDRMVPVAALRLEEALQAAWSPVPELLPSHQRKMAKTENSHQLSREPPQGYHSQPLWLSTDLGDTSSVGHPLAAHGKTQAQPLSLSSQATICLLPQRFWQTLHLLH